jgi:hypothetical protein
MLFSLTGTGGAAAALKGVSTPAIIDKRITNTENALIKNFMLPPCWR